MSSAAPEPNHDHAATPAARVRARAFQVTLLAWVGLFVTVTIVLARAEGSFESLVQDPPLLLLIIAGLCAVVIVVATVSRRRAGRVVDVDTGVQRAQWAESHGWTYRPEPREISPDALSEVDTTHRADPIRILDEATGTHRGRRAFVHSRDTWVRAMTKLDTSRREVVGVEASVELPSVVILTDRNAAAAKTVQVQPAAGLSRVPQPFGTKTVLWTTSGQEHVISGVLHPVLAAEHEWLMIVCSGRWVLISADRDPKARAVTRRLDVADQVAGLLEASSRR